ncbi:MAG: hypothetical protein ACPGRX_03080, partial [Bdellovibrionales bacterium]
VMKMSVPSLGSTVKSAFLATSLVAASSGVANAHDDQRPHYHPFAEQVMEEGWVPRPPPPTCYDLLNEMAAMYPRLHREYYSAVTSPLPTVEELARGGYRAPQVRPTGPMSSEAAQYGSIREGYYDECYAAQGSEEPLPDIPSMDYVR